MKKLITLTALLLCAVVSTWGQTASDKYLDLSNYSTITTAGFGTNNSTTAICAFNEETNWLTVYAYAAVISTSQQKWMELSGNNQTSTTTWEATDVFKGSAAYCSSSSPRVGYINSSNTYKFRVTNCLQTKILANMRSGSGTGRRFSLTIYEINAAGTRLSEDPVFTTTNTKSNTLEVVSSDALDPEKYYEVYVGKTDGSNEFLYEVAFKVNTDNRANVEIDFGAASTSIEAGNNQATTLTLKNPTTHVALGDISKYSIAYSSSNPSVATVDEDGIISAIEYGSATITVEVSDKNKADKAEFKGTKATLNISVTDASAAASTITFPFNDNSTINATYSAGSDKVKSDVVTFGTNVNFDANSDHCFVDADGNDDVEVSRVKPSATSDNTVTFTVTPKYGVKFTPTSVSFVAMKQGTNNPVTLDAAWISEGESDIALGSALALKRASEKSTYAKPGGERFTYDLSAKGAKNATGTFGLKLTLNTSSKSYGIGEIIISGVFTGSPITETIPVSAAGYATFYTDKALDFTGIEIITAYTATKEGNVVKFNKVMGAVPAETGLLVKGVTTNVPVAASAEDVTNIMEGTLTEKTIEDGSFVLLNQNNVIGFYRATGFTARPNSAWLPASVAGSSVRFIGFDDEGGEATGIQEVSTATMKSEQVFNLRGQRVAAPQKGLYIVNGKKVILK